MTRLPRDDELEQWFGSGRANLAVVTGAISGIVVVDIDGPEGEAEIAKLDVPETVEVKTPRGRHLYFKHPGQRVRNGVRLMPGVDVRGDGGYVLVPSSVVNGEPYEFTRALKDVSLAAIPSWFPKRKERSSEKTTAAPEGSYILVEGARNDRLFSEGSWLRHRAWSEKAIRGALLAMNETHCSPPLDAEEVRKIAHSTMRYDADEIPTDDIDTEAPKVAGWEIWAHSLHQIKHNRKGEDDSVEVLPFAPVPIAIYKDEDDEIRGFKILFRWVNRQSVVVVPAAFLYTGGASELLVRSGGPSLSSEQVRILIRFLTDVVAGRANVEPMRIITRAEWKGAVYSGPGSGPIAAWQTELVGYGQTTPIDDEHARGLWYRILERATGSPKSMIVLGMPIGSLYIRPLKLNNFALHITSESSSGKTESAEIAMSTLGSAQKPQGLLYRTWDVSEQAPIALFRQVGCMPVWFDETAVLGDDTRFSTIIFRLAQGVNRMRADAYGGLVEGSSSRWDTCLLSTGEARITITSALSGMQRRVLEILAPLTDVDAHHYMLENARLAYGWPLQWFVQDPDVVWAADFHRRVMDELTKVSRNQQVEFSQAANVATCAMGFAVLCRLSGYSPIPERRILKAAVNVFSETLELAGELGSDIGERALIGLKEAIRTQSEKFPAPNDSLFHERWGVMFDDGCVGIMGEKTLAQILERYAGLPDTVPVVKRWAEGGVLVTEGGRKQSKRTIWVPGSGLKLQRMYILRVGED